MGDVNISSKNQRGGITAQNVTTSSIQEPAEPKPDSAWVRWATISGVLALIAALITLYLTNF